MAEVESTAVKRIPWSIEDFRIRLISWNIFGLEEDEIQSRTKAACSIINQIKPHAVFLQEMVQEQEEIIREMCSEYDVKPSKDRSYYNAVLLRKDAVQKEEDEIIPFPNTKMGRNLLMVKCLIKGEKFCLMTSHLESMKECAGERFNQLKMAFSLMTAEDPCRTVIFGGDLNLRGNETCSAIEYFSDPTRTITEKLLKQGYRGVNVFCFYKQLSGKHVYKDKDGGILVAWSHFGTEIGHVEQAGGIPDGIYDIWEVTGSRPEAKFSWNCRLNDNLDWVDAIQDDTKKPRIRFDRLYTRYSSPAVAKPVYFELFGQQRIPECDYFCSDHWGLLAHFNILSKVPK